MKAVAENLLCGVSVYSIFNEDGGACKAEYLSVVEELHDVLVAFSEMASMTFIENHYDAGMAYFLNTAAVPLFADSGVQLLYGGDYNFRVAMQTFHQFVRVVGAVNGSRLKGFIFGLRLCIKVVAVNHKHHLVHVV